MERPHTIAVNVTVHEDMPATGAWFYVAIRGSSLVTGDVALKKAREVRDMVQALATVDVPESQIQVSDIHGETKSGLLTSSSSAVYTLKIRVERLDNLANIFGIITGSKTAELQHIEWTVDDEDAFHDRLLTKALGIARERATLICREMQHDNLGIHSLTEVLRDRERSPQRYMSGIAAKASLSMCDVVTDEELGLSVTHHKPMEMDVRVEFLVAPAKGDGHD